MVVAARLVTTYVWETAGLVLTCSDAQNVQWWTKMCSDERLFVQWWSKKKWKAYVVLTVTRVESKVKKGDSGVYSV